jgi:hypothetical protein
MEFSRDRNQNICDTLFGRLSAQGLLSVEILSLIEDVFNIVRDGGYFTVASINHELERLGWREQVMDETSFKLITFILENEYDYEVKSYLLH